MNTYRAITTKDKERFHLAKIVASESLCRYKLGAALYYGNKVVSIACNVIKTHPDHKRFYGKHCISLHSEHACILKARRSVEGTTLYVARYGNMDTYTSKPCPACRAYMELAGVYSVVYELGGQLVKEVL